MVSLSDIEVARRRIADAVKLTPCTRSDAVSALAGATCFFKLENQQRTGSFKERGALNRLLLMTAEERTRGVIAASAGNHAQGLAYHAGRLGIGATIVMPEGTPLIKAQSTRGHGARVVLHGANYDEAFTEMKRLQAQEGQLLIHAFDDPAIVAGQGTIGLELLEQNPYLEVVVVPIGGGGLIAGIATALKEVNPRIRVVGVEPSVLPSMQAALKAGQPVALEPAQTLADGLAVKRAGDITFPIVQKYVDEVVTVDDEETASAILLLLEREKTVVEGAGAAGVAALLHHKIRGVEGRKVAVVLCGGNIDVTMLSRIIERGLVKDGRLVELHVRLPDRPGALAGLTAAVAESRANIVEIHHNRAFSRAAALGETEVELRLETRGQGHVEELIRALSARGYVVTAAEG